LELQVGGDRRIAVQASAGKRVNEILFQKETGHSGTHLNPSYAGCRRIIVQGHPGKKQVMEEDEEQWRE
jgi:hypothetical protein